MKSNHYLKKTIRAPNASCPPNPPLKSYRKGLDSKNSICVLKRVHPDDSLGPLSPYKQINRYLFAVLSF